MNNDKTYVRIEHMFKKGQNPVFDRKITKTFHYTIIVSLIFSILIAFLPITILENIFMKEMFELVMSSTNFFQDKYNSLEYANTGLGFRFVVSVITVLLISTSVAFYTIYVTIRYWNSENTKWNNNYHYSIIVASLGLCFVFYGAFIFDSSLVGVKYPGTLVYLNSKYTIIITSVSIVLMASYIPALLAYVLKIIKYRA